MLRNLRIPDSSLDEAEIIGVGFSCRSRESKGGEEEDRKDGGLCGEEHFDI